MVFTVNYDSFSTVGNCKSALMAHSKFVSNLTRKDIAQLLFQYNNRAVHLTFRDAEFNNIVKTNFSSNLPSSLTLKDASRADLQFPTLEKLS